MRYSYCFLLLLLLNPGQSQKAAAQSPINCEFLAAGTARLDSIFWASDELDEFLPEFKAFEVRAVEAGCLLDFADWAIPFIQNWYQYGFFSESRAQLKSLIKNIPPEDDRFRTQLSDTYYQISRSFYYEKKIDSIPKWSGLSIQAAGPQSVHPVGAYNLLGIYYRRTGNIREAEVNYRKALNSGLANPAVPVDRSSLVIKNLALLYELTVDIPKTNSLVSVVDSLIEAGVQNRFLAEACLILGNSYNAVRQSEKAEYLYQSADILRQNLKLTTAEGQGDLYLNRGRNFSNQGAFREAITYFEQARLVYSELPKTPPRKLSYAYRNLGVAHSRLKDYTLALINHEKSLSINYELRDTFEIADDLTNIGVDFFEKGDYQKAKTLYQQAINYRRVFVADKTVLANDYINLADVYFATNSLDSAMVYADSARLIEEVELGERHPQLAYTYLTQARILGAKRNWEAALRMAQKSLVANHADFGSDDYSQIPQVTGYGKYDYFFEALMLKAELLQQLTGEAKHDMVRAHYLRAGALLDEVKDQLSSREDQITLANYNTLLADAAIEHAFGNWARTQDAGYVDQAFQFAERAKAAVLRSAITGKQARKAAGISDALVQREDELTALIGYYNRALASGTDSTTRVRQQRSLLETTQALKDLRTIYANDYPEYSKLKQQVKQVSLAELQATLLPEELLYSYFTGEEYIYLFSVGRQGSSLHQLPKPVRLNSDVIGLVKGITRNLDRLYLRKANLLFTTLFPSQEAIVGKKLILIPDAALLKVPFEALLTEAVSITETVNFSNLPYLLRNGTISYAPSANLFFEGRQKTANSGAGLLAFAPVFSDGATHSFPQRGSGGDLLLTSLPGTRLELEALESVFKQKEAPAITFIGTTATEAAFRSSPIEQARFIHFATHGFVNERYPDLSGLALYPGGPGVEDNFLSVGEVFTLKLNAELVTLSACETGLGKVASGEGVLGFSRAFLFAGADNLLVSLWQVQDAATATLMVDFYRGVLAETAGSFAPPLHAAKLGLLRNPETSHPYYWSGFILIGE